MDININALESLATKSRARLIGQATGAIQRLLDDPLTETEDRRRIEQAVAHHGGVEDAAREAAYSWFNRLTALRYMDAVGVSGTHMVVTPTGASSEPECLAQARVGAFDPRIDRAPAGPGADGRPGVAQRVGRLLFENRDVEAYVVLLSAYFDLWHPLIPDMFPAGDHWTNLVPPSDLLSASSVRADIVEGIAVGESGGPSVEVIGWLYQFYIAERKQQINDAKVKITSKELAPVTQLFTPHWIVRYLVENTVGAQWLRAHPDSSLRDRFDYLVAPVPGQEDQGLGIGDPKDFRVIDPACGSGHMLTYAFDVLWQMYVEARYPKRRIAAAILDNNLFGAEIDARAVQLSSFALMMKAVEHDPGFLERKLREQDRKAAGLGAGQQGAGRPRITHVHSVVLEDLSPAEIAQAVRGAFGSEDSERASVGLEVNRVIEDLRNADTFGSLIRVPAGTAEVFETVALSIEEGRRDVQLGSADAQQWREAAGICRVLEDSRYTTMVANPPYQPEFPTIKQFARHNYPDSYPDLCTMFIQRAASLVARRGSIGMITMHSWMFLKSYQKLRPWILSAVSLENMAHLGTRAFDSIGGEVVQTTAFTLTNVSAEGNHRSVYLRMTEGTSEAIKDSALRRAARSEDDPHRYTARNSDFARIPGYPIVYWASEGMLAAFEKGTPLAEVARPRAGLCTGNNDYFLRQWFEVSSSHSYLTATSRADAKASGARWFPHNKGGSFRKWWGNQNYVANWFDDGIDYVAYIKEHPKGGTRVQGSDCYFKPCVSWSRVNSKTPSFRMFNENYLPNDKGPIVPVDGSDRLELLSLLNSSTLAHFLQFLSPTVMIEVGQVSEIPWVKQESFATAPIERLIEIFRDDWDARETSWDFQRPPYLLGDSSLLEELFAAWYERSVSTTREAQRLESENNRFWARVYGLEDEVEIDVPLSRVSLTYNPRFAFPTSKGAERSEEEYRWLHYQRSAEELVSWLIGVIMGRYSLDAPGLVLADQGSTLDDFQARVPAASFMPDADGIIPITDSLFHDNADLRLADALSALLGADSLGQNLDFLARCLAVKKPTSSGTDFQPPRPVVDSRAALLKYMKSGFLKDHEQAYSNCPVYWMFSSPKGGFKALMYLHRYTPDTVGHVLTEYASEVVAKLADQIQVLDRRLPDMGGSDRTRALRKREKLSAQLHDVQGYIDSTLYPLSQRRIVLDLDDGVRVNRLKLAYGMREELDDLASPALDVRSTDLTWMRKEERKGNIWWSTQN